MEILRHCSVAAMEHPSAEIAISDEFLCFPFATRDLVQQLELLQGPSCIDRDSDYALEESDPQWVASEFVDPSVFPGISELSDFPSHQGKPRTLNPILVFS